MSLIFTPIPGEIRSKLTRTYFSAGLAQPPTIRNCQGHTYTFGCSPFRIIQVTRVDFFPHGTSRKPPWWSLLTTQIFTHFQKCWLGTSPCSIGISYISTHSCSPFECAFSKGHFFSIRRGKFRNVGARCPHATPEPTDVRRVTVR